MNKLWSGKFLFTLAAAIVFVGLAASGRMGSDEASQIILVVVYAYFTKKEDSNGETK